MIRPDLALICENMLLSEGFHSARPLSVKFVTLYQLCSELLSPQAHYDWGLRAIKSVLRVAGALKRSDPGIEEEGILMRALRDFNTPKLPSADVAIFLRLIQDLFPRFHTLPTKLNADLARSVAAACKECRPPLQADAGFVAKVVQLQELLDVRHSVMLVGPAGCGKSTVWKTLAAAHNLGRPKSKAATVFEVVDPKAVTSDELYGFMTLAKEWRDGVLSIIMRGMSKNVKVRGEGERCGGGGGWGVGGNEREMPCACCATLASQRLSETTPPPSPRPRRSWATTRTRRTSGWCWTATLTRCGSSP
jgi:dynein heavy chain